MKNFIAEKEKWTNKGNDKHENADLSNIIQQILLNVCMKLQNPRCSSSWEIFDKNFIKEKEKWTNKENDKHKDADSLLHNTSSHTQCLYQISKS